jgi:hypothetical protein
MDIVVKVCTVIIVWCRSIIWEIWVK